MPEKSEEVLGALERLGGNKGDSLEYLGEIPDIEQIVRLLGGGEEAPLDPLVHLQSEPDNSRKKLSNMILETSLEILQNRSEYFDRAFLVEDSIGKDLEMSDESLGDLVSAGPGRDQTAQDMNILYLDVFIVHLFDPDVAVVQILSEQLDGRLGSVDLLGRHIDFIDEEDCLFAVGGPEDAFPSLIYLAEDSVNYLVSTGLGREGHLEPDLGLLQIGGDQSEGVGGLSRADLSWGEDALSV